MEEFVLQRHLGPVPAQPRGSRGGAKPEVLSAGPVLGGHRGGVGRPGHGRPGQSTSFTQKILGSNSQQTCENSAY